MCGRYAIKTSAPELAAMFEISATPNDLEGTVSYNVAPTQSVPVCARDGSRRRLETMRWGLIPSWAKDARSSARMINARAETVASSGAFRASFRSRRAIVPSDGFYEWRRSGSVKQPFFLHPPEGAVLAMAGLWAIWKDPDTGLWVPSAAVITTAANRLVSSIHDRMPVLLPRETWDDWLDPEMDDTDYLQSLLQPAPDDVLAMYPISTAVNNVRNKGPELLDPIEEVEAPTLRLEVPDG